MTVESLQTEARGAVRRTCGKVALFVPSLPPYRVAVFRHLSLNVGQLRIYITTREPLIAAWGSHPNGFDVRIQRCWSIRRKIRHISGVSDGFRSVLPWDTLLHLFLFKPAVTVSSEMGFRTLQAWLYRRINWRHRLIIWATLSEELVRETGFVRTALRRLLIRGADAIVTNGKSGERYLMSLGCPPHRITVIWQAIDVKLFWSLPVRPPERAYDMIFVGRLVPIKGLVPFLRALGNWGRQRPGRSVRLTIVGDGSEAVEIAKIIEQHPTNIHTRMLPSQPYERMPELYRAAGVLILPSFYEEWGLVVNEAMAAGAIVCGSRRSEAVCELVDDGRTGFTFDPLDPDSIYAVFDRLMAASPEDLNVVRAAAQARIAAVTPEAMASAILKVANESG